MAIAPNNTDGTTGYFLIYITAGVYEEYVSIAKNKKYLMMIGDGINQTIITGNHSYNVDGYTTFNSSTFGKYLHHYSIFQVITWRVIKFMYILSSQDITYGITLDNVT